MTITESLTRGPRARVTTAVREYYSSVPAPSVGVTEGGLSHFDRIVSIFGRATRITAIESVTTFAGLPSVNQSTFATIGALVHAESYFRSVSRDAIADSIADGIAEEIGAMATYFGGVK